MPEFNIKIHIIQTGIFSISFEVLASVLEGEKLIIFWEVLILILCLGRRKKCKEMILSAVHCNFRRTLARLLCSVHVDRVCDGDVCFCMCGLLFPQKLHS